MSKETTEKLHLLASKLDEIIQESLKKDLRPLLRYELDAWSDENMMDKKYMLECYIKVYFKKDVESPIEERFEKAGIYKGVWNKIDLGPGAYRFEIVPNSMNDFFTIITENYFGKDSNIYVYPMDGFDQIGIFCDDKKEFSESWSINPMKEIEEFILFGKK